MEPQGRLCVGGIETSVHVPPDDLEQRRHKRVKKRRDEKRREKKAVAATQKLPDSGQSLHLIHCSL